MHQDFVACMLIRIGMIYPLVERRYTNAVNRAVQAVVVLVFLVACGRQADGTTSANPSPAAYPSLLTQASTLEPVKTQVIRSPDGTPRAEQVCYQRPGWLDCRTVFPNGETLSGTPGRWSSDGQFALDCFATTADKMADPCEFFSVWDMVNGQVVTTHLLPFSPFHFVAWSPELPHTLLYIFHQDIEHIPDDLFALDAATGQESILQACPAWVDSQLGHACGAAPGVVVAGAVKGLPASSEAVIRTYDLDHGSELVGYQTVEIDGGSWKQLLRQSLGPDFEITVWLYGYVGNPARYDVHLNGTQVYSATGAQLDPIMPDTLNFALLKQ